MGAPHQRRRRRRAQVDGLVRLREHHQAGRDRRRLVAVVGQIGQVVGHGLLAGGQHGELADLAELHKIAPAGGVRLDGRPGFGAAGVLLRTLPVTLERRQCGSNPLGSSRCGTVARLPSVGKAGRPRVRANLGALRNGLGLVGGHAGAENAANSRYNATQHSTCV